VRSRELIPETRGSILEGTSLIRREDDVNERASVSRYEERVSCRLLVKLHFFDLLRFCCTLSLC